MLNRTANWNLLKQDTYSFFVFYNHAIIPVHIYQESAGWFLRELPGACGNVPRRPTISSRGDHTSIWLWLHMKQYMVRQNSCKRFVLHNMYYYSTWVQCKYTTVRLKSPQHLTSRYFINPLIYQTIKQFQRFRNENQTTVENLVGQFFSWTLIENEL